jgi:hypothetical protein
MDPETKLLLVIDVGTRTLAMAQRVLHQVARCLAPDCIPLFLSDGSCTCALRINPPGSPIDHNRDKKFYMRGLSWPPSGPLTPGDGLDAGRADTRRPLRPPPLSASHHRDLLTPLLAVATAVPATTAPPSGTRHGPSTRRPWPAYRAASIWLSLSRWWAGAGATAGVRWYVANRNYNRPGTRPTAAVRHPRVCPAS